MLSRAEIESLYDRHARSVYGASLLASRHRRDARKALVLAFRDYSRHTPSDSARARFDLLQHGLRWAQQFRSTHLHVWRCRHSVAVRADFGAQLDALSSSEALRLALIELEGIAPEDLASGVASMESRADGWTAPPRSMRSLVVMTASEAADPRRRLRRWAWMWGAVAASAMLVGASEWLAPDLPAARVEKVR